MDSGSSAPFKVASGRGREPAKRTNAVGSSDNARLDSYQSCVNIARVKMVIDDDDV